MSRNLITNDLLDAPTFSKILEIIASLPDVKKDVKDNYWENRWWPLNVKDWRMRILFAGLSTRVSYNAIDSFQNVRNKLNSFGFHRLLKMKETDFREIVTPVGIPSTRWKFWQSLKDFALGFPDSVDEPDALRQLSNDDLILYLRERIWGVGYKVAQGSALYIRGYHCGIITVDSGMKEYLGPCLGFRTSSGERGHELMRKHAETLAKKLDYPYLLNKTGYEDILKEMSGGQINTWWVHLVLIYFKRRYCNFADASKCPLVRYSNLPIHPEYCCMRRTNDHND